MIMTLIDEKTVSIGNVPMHSLTMKETLLLIEQAMSKEGCFLQHVVINVAKLVNMQTQKDLKDSVLACDIINIDGMGIVWGGRFLGLKIPERVAGIDLFSELLSFAQRQGERVFFLGASNVVLNLAVDNLQKTYPDLNIAGWHHGYFGDNELSVVEKIRTSGATMLFVAMSSPQKEKFINKWRDVLGVKFAMGVGGTLDIVAGKTKRAPLWMQRYGLEWLYRVIQEPRRMWKRYLFTNCKFLFLLINEKLKNISAEQ